MAEQQHGFTRTAARKAFAPLAHAAVTAGTAYLTRKAMQLWQDKVQPKLEQQGGGRAVAKETLKNVADKASAATSSNRETQRRQRKQRRNQRRRALEKSGSS
jgi:hypothetical protein